MNSIYDLLNWTWVPERSIIALVTNNCIRDTEAWKVIELIFSNRKTIGVFISKIFASFDNAVFHALEREGRRLNYDIVVFATTGYYLTQNEYDIQEKNIFRMAAIDKLDGIIIVPESYEQGDFRELLFDMLHRHAKCPVVAVRHDGWEFDCVHTDETRAIRPLVRHLIEHHGLRKIRFQTGFSGHIEADARLKAFRQEMADHGLEVRDEDICEGNMWTNCAEEAWDRFFSNPDDWPEAVVCANDYMAVGLMRLLLEKGIRVPEDVIVTGFDNIRGAAPDMPGLTTIQPDYDEMVVRAMDHLDRRIRGVSERHHQTRISLEGRLVLGESCGCGKRSPEYFREVSRRTTALLEQEDDQDRIMNCLSIDLGACDDLKELHEVMINKRAQCDIIRDHYLCLFGDSDSLMDEGSPHATLVHAIRDGRDCGMPMITFDRQSLLPAMAERRDEPQMLFMKLLHQRGHNFGYSITQYVPGEVPSRIFVQVNALLSIALENIYRRRELMRLYEERRMSSITDMMTGLLNRRGLMERLEPIWHSLVGVTSAFVSIDMDRLKHINDNYGHAAGDFAIRLLGRAIQAAMPRDGVAARIGGDEFLVFLPSAGCGEADAFLERFDRTLDRLNAEENRSFAVSASAGCTVIRLNELDTIESCIHDSDTRMYQVKEEHHAARQ